GSLLDRHGIPGTGFCPGLRAGLPRSGPRPDGGNSGARPEGARRLVPIVSLVPLLLVLGQSPSVTATPAASANLPKLRANEVMINPHTTFLLPDGVVRLEATVGDLGIVTLGA